MNGPGPAEIVARYRRSWMSDTPRRRDVGALVVGAQRDIQRAAVGNEYVMDPAFSVEVLCDDVARAVGRIEVPGERVAASRSIIYGSAMLAELLAASLCPRAQMRGRLFPHFDEDEDWHRIFAPLLALRNALFHPGSIRTEAESEAPWLGTHVERFRNALVRLGGQGALVEEIVDAPGAIFGSRAAHWSIAQVDAAGIEITERWIP